MKTKSMIHFLSASVAGVLLAAQMLLAGCNTSTPIEPKKDGAIDSIALEVQYIGKNELTVKTYIQSASGVSFAYIQYAPETDGESKTEMLPDDAEGENLITLNRLGDRTTYSLTLHALLGNGDEMTSRTIRATTGAPVLLEETGNTETSISFRFTLNTTAEIYTKGYTYKIRSSKDQPANVLLPNEAVSEVTLTDLQPLATYQIQGYALMDGNDEMLYSDVLEIQVGKTPIEGDYKLVFSAEFDTDNEDLTKVWRFEEGEKIRNNENQFYSKSTENAFTKDGYLHIVARRNHLGSDGKTHDYTSASMTTANSFVYCYGIVEVRAKIPTGGGMWPAIWQVGNTFSWPQNGELDLMEYYRESILANAAWGGTKAWSPVWASSKKPMSHFENQNPNWRNEFHVWRLEWTEESLKMFLDDELLNEVAVSRTQNQGYGGNYENPYTYCQEGFGHYLWLNLAIGGNNGGTIDNSLFPAEYLIDYVRVYQRVRLPEDK